MSRLLSLVSGSSAQPDNLAPRSRAKAGSGPVSSTAHACWLHRVLSACLAGGDSLTKLAAEVALFGSQALRIGSGRLGPGESVGLRVPVERSFDRAKRHQPAASLFGNPRKRKTRRGGF